MWGPCGPYLHSPCLSHLQDKTPPEAGLNLVQRFSQGLQARLLDCCRSIADAKAACYNSITLLQASACFDHTKCNQTRLPAWSKSITVLQEPRKSITQLMLMVVHAFTCPLTCFHVVVNEVSEAARLLWPTVIPQAIVCQRVLGPAVGGTWGACGGALAAGAVPCIGHWPIWINAAGTQQLMVTHGCRCSLGSGQLY